MKRDLTIFYADDDQEDLDFFREIVDTIDDTVVVHTQSTGQQLMNALNNPPPTPHLIFLDINMPGMNGFDVLKKVRNSENHKELPIVVFSTSGDEDAIKKSRELGATFYVQKSSVFDQLKKSIEHALKINWGTFITSDNNFVYHFS
jgi:CheY-like chemotaxis protein